jgi:predicted AAA+ superfamily ATPase
MGLDESRKWRRSHTDIILRQDLLSIETIKDIDSLEVLLEMLSTRVGSTVSYNSLAEDLRVSDNTIKKWLQVLEDLYVVFRVPSYSHNISRGLSKSGKYYFYDLARVQGDEAAKFENLVALSFRKELDFLEDTQGLRTKLNFIRNKAKKEIDFFVQVETKKSVLFEVKLNEDKVSENFKIFSSQLPKAMKVQLVAHLQRRYDSKDGVQVEPGLRYLENLRF